MADPITSQYFPRPPDDAGGNSGTTGNDPAYSDSQVPDVTMGWDSWNDLPSFNVDPTGATTSSGTGAPTGTPLNETPLSVNLITMRSIERDMLAATDRAVEAYTALKAKVESAISGGAIYGQVDTDQTPVDTTTSGGQPGQGYMRTDPSPLQGPAKDFAAKMDNYQRGALIGIAKALDVVGSYIAAINIAGTTYAYTDRHAKFPPPPAS